ncbi:MAG: hypothetical protein M0D53_08705 [Flavobacterium sp. JAD_PAG50586_2]|nr:MAG: hypothetical protein M0D53_08705 [Flavobacterium sp. JAD_PAG50586_2]
MGLGNDFAFPYGSTYTFILLMFPFLALITSYISTVKIIVSFLILFGIGNLPLSVFITGEFPLSYLRLFLLLAFFVLFLTQLKQKINLRFIALVSFVPIIFVLVFRKEETVLPQHFLTRNIPILTYDYQISNGQLTYFYWGKKGENKRTLKLCKPNFEPLEIVNNQIFYHKKQLTFDNSNKLKPVLVNKNALLYLTDYGRGIGFYALKKIEIRGK